MSHHCYLGDKSLVCSKCLSFRKDLWMSCCWSFPRCTVKTGSCVDGMTSSCSGSRWPTLTVNTAASHSEDGSLLPSNSQSKLHVFPVQISWERAGRSLNKERGKELSQQNKDVSSTPRTQKASVTCNPSSGESETPGLLGTITWLV